MPPDPRPCRSAALGPLLGLPCALLLPLLAALSGCGGPSTGPVEPRAGRERPAPLRPAREGASAAERLLGARAWEPTGAAPAPHGAVPAGWTPRERGPLRLAAYAIPGPEGEAEVSLTRAGGRRLANLNLWRAQLGLPAADESALAELPPARLGAAPARRVDLRGTHHPGTLGGAAPEAPRPGWRLVGWLPDSDEGGLFLKAVGPEALLERALPDLEAFAASVTPDGAAGAEAAEAPPARAGLAYDLPPGWRATPGREGLRLLTLAIDGAPGTEGVLARIAGGDPALHLSLLQRQMGLPELDAASLGALAPATLLGREGVRLDLRGEYRGGRAPLPAARLLARAARDGGDLVLLRLVGPSAEVDAQAEAFEAFAGSLREAP